MVKQTKKEIDYKALFIIGIVFMASGGALFTAINPLTGLGLFGLGIVFLIAGGANKNKWKNK